MTTTTDIMELVREYADEYAADQKYRSFDSDPDGALDALRTAVERLVAERDALRTDLAGERGVLGRWIAEALPTLVTLINEDSEDGGEYLRGLIASGQRLAAAALEGKP